MTTTLRTSSETRGGARVPEDAPPQQLPPQELPKSRRLELILSVIARAEKLDRDALPVNAHRELRSAVILARTFDDLLCTAPVMRALAMIPPHPDERHRRYPGWWKKMRPYVDGVRDAISTAKAAVEAEIAEAGEA